MICQLTLDRKMLAGKTCQNIMIKSRMLDKAVIFYVFSYVDGFVNILQVNAGC